MTEIAATAPFHHIHLGRTSWVTGDIFTRGPSIGSLHAGEPWDFSRIILFEFQTSDIDDEHPEWMINWFAGVSLLRTVGHTLRNVDHKRSASAKSAIDSFWEAINADRESHWIFFDFINRERNNILKEFSFGASLPSNHDGTKLLAYDTHADWDAIQLFREAVYWWRAQLENIERHMG